MLWHSNSGASNPDDRIEAHRSHCPITIFWLIPDKLYWEYYLRLGSSGRYADVKYQDKVEHLLIEEAGHPLGRVRVAPKIGWLLSSQGVELYTGGRGCRCCCCHKECC